MTNDLKDKCINCQDHISSETITKIYEKLEKSWRMPTGFCLRLKGDSEESKIFLKELNLALDDTKGYCVMGGENKSCKGYDSTCENYRPYWKVREVFKKSPAIKNKAKN